MARLNSTLKVKIIRLRRNGKRLCDILRILEDQDNFTISRRHLSKFINRYETTACLNPPPPKKRKSPKTTPEVLSFIDRKMEENDETTSTDLSRMIKSELSLEISDSTLRHVRKKLGWLSSGSKYCQLVREPNRAKRLEYCRTLLSTKEKFDDVIFTDECTVAMESHAKLSFHRWWEPPVLKPKPKHPYKIHVWAGISRKGATKIALFNGIMNAEFFTTKVLELHLKPFIRNVYPDGHRFMQDNDPKHTSKAAKNYYKEAEINWWPTPPESRDLNPIELVWHELKHFLGKTHKPKTKE